MEYKKQNCPICGSMVIQKINSETADGDVFYTYRCHACGEVFHSSKPKVKKERPSSMPAHKEERSLTAVEVYKKNRESVIEIVADFGNVTSNGTGMILPSGLVLTNAHVVIERKNCSDAYETQAIEGIFSDAHHVTFQIERLDVKRDMALLRANIDKRTSVVFSDRELEIGEKVYAIGNSKGQGICMTDGIVSDKERMIAGEKYLMYSAPTVGGNSGGPLFDDHGEVIGMVTLGQKDGTLMNYAIPVEILKKFVYC